MKPRRAYRWLWTLPLLTRWVTQTALALDAGTNTVTLPTNLPDVGASLLRVFGALALVIAVFLGGVWLVRNWQRLAVRGGPAPRLHVLEVRSLGGRHALYVVGYEQERYLVASSPAGVNLLSHLPAAEGSETVPEPASAAPSFAAALTHVLRGK